MSRRALPAVRALRVTIVSALAIGAITGTAPFSPPAAAKSAARVAAKQTQTTVASLSADVPVEEDEDDVVDTTLVPVPGPAQIPTAGTAITIVCPVPGAKFQNDYGAPRGSRSHAGNDMLAPRGTPILAPAAGMVKHKWSSLGGLSFYLDTPSGARFFGTHLQSAGASGPVEAGTVIGYVGDTGNARGTPHLHFEYHPTKSARANPYPMLVKACR